MTAAGLGCAVALSACGGTTVTSDDVAASSATSQASATTTAKQDKDKDKETTPSAAVAPAREGEEPRRDEPAAEISSVPKGVGAPVVTETDRRYLDALHAGGVDTAGMEDVLIGAAGTVCAGDPVSAATPAAVAGQLVEQGRTDKPVDEVTTLLQASARDTYCAGSPAP
ncbi:DUF732 domain-containing protein [Corynebacterium uterequi]|uniref:DUF732 domain-containing protein n=1 Tax=Corynebacterium uterequi TaxID=1072256 RepID=UPI0011874344|nr:DUF732 domain-containing protein [Corynebacterium uterequi]